MHSDSRYHITDRALQEAMLSEIGFGIVIVPIDGLIEIAQVPLLSTGDGAVQFHVGRSHPMAPHLAQSMATIMVNGPDAYISPRWTGEKAAVPTWNYVSLEINGLVRRIDQDSVEAMLEALVARQEAAIPAGNPWSRADISEQHWRALHGQLVGFELEGKTWHATFKLSQEKSAQARANIADGLEANGSPAVAELIRGLANGGEPSDV